MNVQVTINSKSSEIRLKPLAFFISISLVTLAMGGLLTVFGKGSWYDLLKVPAWQPPSWIFTPVWTLLLLALAVATYLVFEGPKTKLRGVALTIYAAQIILNVAWSLFFFTFRSPSLALVDVILLDVVLFSMIFLYKKSSLIAAALIIPYLLWSLFATAVNYWIVFNN